MGGVKLYSALCTAHIHGIIFRSHLGSSDVLRVFLLLQSWATEEQVDHDGTRNRTMKQEAGELAPTKLPSTIPAKKRPGPAHFIDKSFPVDYSLRPRCPP